MAQESPYDQYASNCYHVQADQGSRAPVNGEARSAMPIDLNRHRLLAKVDTFWITGVLAQSLHEATFLALGLQEQPHAITDPWMMNHAVSSLPTGIHITQVYDQVEGELLLLGAPGAGKTTLLLQLARDLLRRAQHDEAHPMPVIFNLSSWATKRQPLGEWLVEELYSKYEVPLLLGREWIVTNQILPLLDGLDEVREEQRAACVEAINVYRRAHTTPMVVCCRQADYDALGHTARLRLHNAIAVEPLTALQIDDYLARAGEDLAAVREILRTDRDLP